MKVIDGSTVASTSLIFFWLCMLSNLTKVRGKDKMLVHPTNNHSTEKRGVAGAWNPGCAIILPVYYDMVQREVTAKNS